MTTAFRLITCAFLVAPSLCNAMTVVADHGGIPTAPFYESLNESQAIPESPSPRPPRRANGLVGAQQMLPVMSQLTPGKVETKQIQLATLPAPLFVVSDDPRSLAWLQQHYEALQRMQAIGWAVNVRDQTALNRIKSAVPGLTVQPMHVDDFAARLGLQHYPALITSTSVEQ